MNRTAKVTRIEKKYKDKKTGELKSLTIDYSKVKDRLKEFREGCPRGSIVTSHTILTDRITFRAHIIKDKGDVASAEATGHATGKDDGSEKVFEKLETIAVGRALALLGYSSDGEIASSEEMEAYLEYTEQQKLEYLEQVTERISSATSIEELKSIWIDLNGETKLAMKGILDTKKIELNEKNQNAATDTGVAPVAKRKNHRKSPEGHSSEERVGA